MTVGSSVKSCYFAIKSAEATLEQLAIKSINKESKEAFSQAYKILTQVRKDLKKQVIYLVREEPEYE